MRGPSLFLPVTCAHRAKETTMILILFAFWAALGLLVAMLVGSDSFRAGYTGQQKESEEAVQDPEGTAEDRTDEADDADDAVPGATDDETERWTPLPAEQAAEATDGRDDGSGTELGSQTEPSGFALPEPRLRWGAVLGALLGGLLTTMVLASVAAVLVVGTLMALLGAVVGAACAQIPGRAAPEEGAGGDNM